MDLLEQDKKDLCHALFLLRYEGHDPISKGKINLGKLENGLKWATRILRLSRKLGVSKEYLNLIFSRDVSVVTCTSLEFENYIERECVE